MDLGKETTLFKFKKNYATLGIEQMIGKIGDETLERELIAVDQGTTSTGFEFITMRLYAKRKETD